MMNIHLKFLCPLLVILHACNGTNLHHSYMDIQDKDQLLQSDSSHSYHFSSSSVVERRQLTATQFRYYDDDYPGTLSSYNGNGNYEPAYKHQLPPHFPAKPWFYKGPGRSNPNLPYNTIKPAPVYTNSYQQPLAPPAAKYPQSIISAQIPGTPVQDEYARSSPYKHATSSSRYADGTPVPWSSYSSRPSSIVKQKPAHPQPAPAPASYKAPEQYVDNVQQNIYHHEYHTNVQNTYNNHYVNLNQQQQYISPSPQITYAPTPVVPAPQPYLTPAVSPPVVRYAEYSAPAQVAQGPSYSSGTSLTYVPQTTYSQAPPPAPVAYSSPQPSAYSNPQPGPAPPPSFPSYQQQPQPAQYLHSSPVYQEPPVLSTYGEAYGSYSSLVPNALPSDHVYPEKAIEYPQVALAGSGAEGYGRTNAGPVVPKSIPYTAYTSSEPEYSGNEAQASYPQQLTVPIVPEPNYGSSSRVSPSFSNGEYYTHSTYASPYKHVHIEYFKHLITPATRSYDVEFKSGNGIHQQESGYLKTIPGYSTGYGYNQPQVANVKTGRVSWTSPEGIPFTVSYIADENGFRPVGPHISPVNGVHQEGNHDNYGAYASTNYEMVSEPSEDFETIIPDAPTT